LAELIAQVQFLGRGPKSVSSETIREVAADASTYLHEGRGYRHMIAFA
jgi:hypothetical protein